MSRDLLLINQPYSFMRSDMVHFGDELCFCAHCYEIWQYHYLCDNCWGVTPLYDMVYVIVQHHYYRYCLTCLQNQ